MQQKYAYAYNGLYNWIKGVLWIPSTKTQLIAAYGNQAKTLVWRNHYTEAYKVGQAFTQQPMDLSNYLFVRTRERLLFENKVNAPSHVNKSGKVNKFTEQFSQKSLSTINDDLGTTLPQLQNILYVLSPQQEAKMPDLPVAFATNTLYVLERNGAGQ